MLVKAHALPMLGVIVFFFSQPLAAQFERLNEIVRALEKNGSDHLTPETALHLKPSIVQSKIISPLAWELQKLEFQKSLINDALLRVRNESDKTLALLSHYEIELLKSGITRTEDVPATHLRAEELKENKLAIEAELEAVQKLLTSQNDRQDVKVNFELKSKAIEYQEKIIAILDQEFYEIKKLHETGSASVSAIRDVQRRLLEAQKQLASARADMEVQRAGISQELSSAIAALQSKHLEIEVKLNLLKDKPEFSQLLDLARNKKDLETKSQHLGERHRLLETALSTIELEENFLSQVLSNYKKALEKQEKDEAKK